MLVRLIFLLLLICLESLLQSKAVDVQFQYDAVMHYLKDYANAGEAEDSLAAFFCFYSHERIHLALGYRTSAEVYGATDGSPC